MDDVALSWQQLDGRVCLEDAGLLDDESFLRMTLVTLSDRVDIWGLLAELVAVEMGDA